MQATYVALLLIAAALLALLRPSWGPAFWLVLAPLCAVWQAPAALIITLPGGAKHGVSPFLFWGALAWLILAAEALARVVRGGWRGALAVYAPARWTLPLAAFAFFLLYGMLTAVTLPFLFEGTPVHLLGRIEGDTIPPEPLRWNLGHAAQMANAIAALALLLLAVASTRARSALLIGTLGAAILSIGVQLLQRAATFGWVTFPMALFPLNPSYNQHFGPTGRVDSPFAERVSLPFIEPSYASAWFAAIGIGALWALLFLRWPSRLSVSRLPRSVRAVPWLRSSFVSLALFGLAIAAAAGMVSARGTTGLAAFVIASAVSIGLLVFIPHRRWLVGLVIVVLGGLGLMAQIGHLDPDRLAARLGIHLPAEYAKVQDHLRSDSPPEAAGRRASDRRAWVLLAETWGLGVGLGSHRPSGYLHAVAANTGLIGLACFLVAFGAWLRRQGSLLRGQATPARAGVAAGFFTLFIAMLGGIPDVLWPQLWVALVLACSVEADNPVAASKTINWRKGTCDKESTKARNERSGAIP